MHESIQTNIMGKLLQQWLLDKGDVNFDAFASALNEAEQFLVTAAMINYKIIKDGMIVLHNEELDVAIQYLIGELHQHPELPAFPLVEQLFKKAMDFVEAYRSCDKQGTLRDWFATGMERFTEEYLEHSDLFLLSVNMLAEEKERG